MTEAVAPEGAAAPVDEAAALGPRPPITLMTRLFYGFGSIAYGVKDNGFRVFLLIFYNQVIGLPAAMVAAAVMTAMLVDCLIDPVIGHWSDHFRSRWGRRHPFMYFSALPVALSFLLLWNPPTDWSDQGIFWYLVVVAVIVRTFITLYEIPSSAMSAELTQDYTERSRMLGWRFFFGWWGGLTLILVMYWFLMRSTPEYPTAQLNPQSYREYGVVGAVLMFLSIIISAAGTHKFIPWLPQPGAPRNRTLLETGKEVFETLNIRPFLAISGVGLVSAIAIGMQFSLSVYITTFVWELNRFWAGVLQIDAFFAAGLAVAAAPFFTRRSGKKKAGSILLVAAVFVGFIPLILRLVGLFPDNGAMVGDTQIPQIVPWLFLDGIVRGVLGITSTILITAMLADVVEYSELRTGRRSEGLFFAFTSLIQKAISGVGLMAAGVLLQIVEFPTKVAPADMPPEIITKFLLVYMPVVGVLYIISMGILQTYNITKESHEETVRELAARRQAGVDGATAHTQ
jgi:GPH family glycoside/pentoside/hexuronide:cation symporter